MPTAAIKDDFERFFDRFCGVRMSGPPVSVFETTWAPLLDFSKTEKEHVVRL